MMSTNWLNYNHLYYFWLVAKEGGVTNAAQQLRLSPSTVSSQIGQLESVIGHALFKRAHRQMVLTDIGRRTFQYANEIFATGQRLQEMLRSQIVSNTLTVGVAMVVPKLVVLHVLPMEAMVASTTRLTCIEGPPTTLLESLSLGKVDLVLSDAPAPVSSRMQVYSHLLGRSPVGLFSTRTLLERHECSGVDVQTCLEKMPLLLSTTHANLRMSFDSYCSQEGIEPKVVAEFQDSAQIKVYGQYEWGAFLAPICIASDICSQYNFELIGKLPFDTGFFAITTEKEIRDTVVMNVIEQSRAWFTEQALRTSTVS